MSGVKFRDSSRSWPELCSYQLFFTSEWIPEVFKFGVC